MAEDLPVELGDTNIVVPVPDASGQGRTLRVVPIDQVRYVTDVRSSGRQSAVGGWCCVFLTLVFIPTFWPLAMVTGLAAIGAFQRTGWTCTIEVMDGEPAVIRAANRHVVEDCHDRLVRHLRVFAGPEYASVRRPGGTARDYLAGAVLILGGFAILFTYLYVKVDPVREMRNAIALLRQDDRSRTLSDEYRQMTSIETLVQTPTLKGGVLARGVITGFTREGVELEAPTGRGVVVCSRWAKGQPLERLRIGDRVDVYGRFVFRTQATIHLSDCEVR